MEEFGEGDRIRVDIADETDPDFEWHGQHGTIIDILQDDAGELTGDSKDNLIYRVDLDEYEQIIDLRRWGLRPPFDE